MSAWKRVGFCLELQSQTIGDRIIIDLVCSGARNKVAGIARAPTSHLPSFKLKCYSKFILCFRNSFFRKPAALRSGGPKSRQILLVLSVSYRLSSSTYKGLEVFKYASERHVATFRVNKFLSGVFPAFLTTRSVLKAVAAKCETSSHSRFIFSNAV